MAKQLCIFVELALKTTRRYPAFGSFKFCSFDTEMLRLKTILRRLKVPILKAFCRSLASDNKRQKGSILTNIRKQGIE